MRGAEMTEHPGQLSGDQAAELAVRVRQLADDLENDPAAGPVTPTTLRAAQVLVDSAAEHLARRNALVRRAIELGWTKLDVGRALGISDVQVGRILAGRDRAPR